MPEARFWKDRFWGVFDNLLTQIILTIAIVISPIVLAAFTQEIILRIVLLLLSITAITIAIILFRKKSSEEPFPCDHYGIRIQSPRIGDSVGTTFTVRGTFEKMPPDDRVKLFKIDIDDQYWPLSTTIKFDAERKEWQGQVPHSGNPGTQTTIMVAVVGKAGRILCDYYEKVGKKSGYWYGIDTLTPDIYECDRVMTTVR